MLHAVALHPNKMNKLMTNAKILIIFIFWVFTSTLYSQSYQADQTTGKIAIKGTSSLHDWVSEVTAFSINASLDFDEPSGTGEVLVKSTSIKSGKSLMDSKTYEALKASQFPDIKFVVTNIKMDGNTLFAKGKLSIAGITRDHTIQLDFTRSQDKIKLIGETKFKMTDYSVQPPTAMFGTVTTGDEVTIEVNLYLNIKK